MLNAPFRWPLFGRLTYVALLFWSVSCSGEEPANQDAAELHGWLLEEIERARDLLETESDETQHEAQLRILAEEAATRIGSHTLEGRELLPKQLHEIATEDVAPEKALLRLVQALEEYATALGREAGLATPEESPDAGEPFKYEIF